MYGRDAEAAAFLCLDRRCERWPKHAVATTRRSISRSDQVRSHIGTAMSGRAGVGQGRRHRQFTVKRLKMHPRLYDRPSSDPTQLYLYPFQPQMPDPKTPTGTRELLSSCDVHTLGPWRTVGSLFLQVSGRIAGLTQRLHTRYLGDVFKIARNDACMRLAAHTRARHRISLTNSQHAHITQIRCRSTGPTVVRDDRCKCACCAVPL